MLQFAIWYSKAFIEIAIIAPQISRKDVDQFEPGQWIPECQLVVEWEREGQRPVRLRHKVDLIGAKKPFNFILLTLNPAMEGNWVMVLVLIGAYSAYAISLIRALLCTTILQIAN